MRPLNKKLMTIASTIDKEELQQLPTALFPGKIVLLNADEIDEKLEETWRAVRLWGFDTESKPIFKKGAPELSARRLSHWEHDD